MSVSRRYVLSALLAVALGVAGAVLFDVLGTVFFAVTVAYLLVPVHRYLVDRGLSPEWSSAATTVGAVVAGALPLTTGSYLLYRRREHLLGILRSAPDSVRIDALGSAYVLDLGAATDLLRSTLVGLLRVVATALPVLAIKFSLFAILVFALLSRRGEAGAALLDVVPVGYHDVAAALHERTRDTLYAIYVLQAATAVVTGLLAYPVFVLFGYAFPGTLAVLAATLQFLPIVGPSVLVLSLAVYHLVVGEFVAAVLVVAVGLAVVAWLPDVLVRTRLAAETTDLPGSLYFVGFTGGLLTVGPIGIIAGPLAVALLVEVSELVAVDLAGDGRDGEHETG